MRKNLFIMIFVLILMIGTAAAATDLSPLNIQGTTGNTVSGSVNAISDEITNYPGVLTVSNLNSGNNILQASRITIIPSINHADSMLHKWTVTIDIPQSLAPGIYIGLMTLSDQGKTLDTAEISVSIASNITPGASFTLSEVTFGSDEQQRGETATAFITLTNTGSEQLSIALSSNIDPKYSLTFSQNNINIAPGLEAKVQATINVPEDQDSGKQSIGTITAVATNANTPAKSANVFLETKSELVITRVKVDVDGKVESLDDGEEFDAKPGDEVIMTVTLKNEFDDNIDIEDIEINVESDSDLDWDDDTDINDLKDGDKEEVEFSFSVPDDIDEDNYDIEIRVEGEDENGAMHEYDYTVTANIERKNHEITITSVSVNPSRISCGGRVILKANIENTGSNDEDDVTLAFENDKLGISEYYKRISLDEGDDMDKTLSFDIPKSMPVGEYIIDVLAYYDNKQTDIQVASVYVDTCSTGGNTGNTGNTGNNTIITPTTPPIIIPTGTISPTSGNDGFLDSTTYIILLAAAVLLILVMIILLMIKFIF